MSIPISVKYSQLSINGWFNIWAEPTVGGFLVYIFCFCGRTSNEDNPPPPMFFQQSRSLARSQVVDKSCSQYHQFSSIGCKTRKSKKKRRSSRIRSKILASKLKSSPKVPSFLTSNGLQRDSLVSSEESSPVWSLWTGGIFCSATRSSLGTNWCWSERWWRKEEVTGSYACLIGLFVSW